jgi:hypothetical protein
MQKFNSKISQTKYLEFFTIEQKNFKKFGTIKINLIYVEIAHVQQYILFDITKWVSLRKIKIIVFH